jgi:hypothetical protein
METNIGYVPTLGMKNGEKVVFSKSSEVITNVELKKQLMLVYLNYK